MFVVVITSAKEVMFIRHSFVCLSVFFLIFCQQVDVKIKNY